MANSGMLNPYYMPSHKSESSVTLDTLIGGLNTYEMPYRLGVNETPDVVNLLWRDGALGGRDAQAWLCSTAVGVGYTCFDGTYYDREFYHIGDKLYATTGVPEKMTATFGTAGDHVIEPLGFTRVVSVSDPAAVVNGNVVTLPKEGVVTIEYYAVSFTPVCDLSALYKDYTPSRGVFLRYRDDLIYKAEGVFVRIQYQDGVFTASDILADAYTPITYINADAASGTGDAYQPENRLSPKKTIWYNASTIEVVESHSLSATTTAFKPKTDYVVRVTDVYKGGARIIEGVDWDYDRASNKVKLYNPSEPSEYVVHVSAATDRYHIPIKNAKSVSIEAQMESGGDIRTLTKSKQKLTEEPTGWVDDWDGDYVFWEATGLVLFKKPPYVAIPAAANTVRITYSLDNPAAREAIMSCKYAVVYGGDTELCLLLAGSAGQPNAFFWNGNNVAMDVTYWPVDSYNLAGDNSEPITGFGKQQSMLVIFKENSVSKATLGTQTINDRLYISMDTVGVNSKIGCDLPYSIQLIDNNLVFCNTQGGIHVLLDTSAANENNIRGISKKVNGTPARAGILQKVRAAGAERCVSFDDDARYWLVIGDEVYVWDYVLSTYKDPSFFYLTNIPAVSFARSADALHYLNRDGRITVLGKFTEADSPFGDFMYTDYGAPISKRYITPYMFFGDYDRLKDVTGVIFTVSSDTWSQMHITYTTDCETRSDLTDARYLFHVFSPRNLHARCLARKTFAATMHRKPGCRHVRYFSMTIEGADAGLDMSLVSAQIFYKKQGRDR